MIEHKQRKPRYCDGARKNNLYRPVVQKEFGDVVQAEHQLVSAESKVDCDDLIDIQSVG